MGWILTSRMARVPRERWIELGFGLFVLVNTAGILVFSQWSTVPFHFIWIGLSVLYGWLVWSIRATLAVLASVIVLTGVALGALVVRGIDRPDDLTEVPLMAIVFLVMVWYVRRHVAAREETRRVSERNLALLKQERQLIQDTSHVLRTPLTIALGHAELLCRTTADPIAAQDAQVVIEELNRLTLVCDRLLTLAATAQPDFAHPVPTPVHVLVTHVWSRWSPTDPAVELGEVVEAWVSVDPARFVEALDELIGNAVQHTPEGTPIRLSAQRRDGQLVVAVADRGPGIPPGDQDRILERFARLSRDDGDDQSKGLGLGLAMVKAIAEAHGGSLAVHSEPGHGTTFELRFPLRTGAAGELDAGHVVAAEVVLSPSAGSLP
jgi:two-component system OmpR family sensor kinase